MTKTDKNNESYWQEIFDSIDMDYLPIEYMNHMIITFEDGTVWDIDIHDSRRKQPIEEIEDSLEQLMETYNDTITNIDFRMDMESVRKDITKRVNRFIKLNK